MHWYWPKVLLILVAITLVGGCGVPAEPIQNWQAPWMGPPENPPKIVTCVDIDFASLPAGWTRELPGIFVRDIATGKDGEVWVGTEDGASHYAEGIWTHYGTDDGLVNNFVLAVTVGLNGDVWFGTKGGVSLFDGTSWTSYTTADGLADDNVRAILVASDGTLWFGTWRSGVSRFNGQEWTTYTTADGLMHNHVTSIAETADGTIWFGTQGGLSYLDKNNTWTSPSFLEVMIADVKTDSNGSVWVGTGDAGVFHFDGTEWTTYTEDFLGESGVMALAITPDGIWFGSSWGTSFFDAEEETWTPYSLGQTDGCCFVTDIEVASDSALWFALSPPKQKAGVVRYSPSNSD